MSEAKHKIRVRRSNRRQLWYVKCSCNWQPGIPAPSKKIEGRDMYGRDTWDAAFALGIAHQQNENGRGEA